MFYHTMAIDCTQQLRVDKGFDHIFDSLGMNTAGWLSWKLLNQRSLRKDQDDDSLHKSVCLGGNTRLIQG